MRSVIKHFVITSHSLLRTNLFILYYAYLSLSLWWQLCRRIRISKNHPRTMEWNGSLKIRFFFFIGYSEALSMIKYRDCWSWQCFKCFDKLQARKKKSRRSKFPMAGSGTTILSSARIIWPWCLYRLSTSSTTTGPSNIAYINASSRCAQFTSQWYTREESSHK